MGGVVSKIGDGLGDLAGSVGNVVSDAGSAIGDIAESDLGKAALLAGGAYFGAPLLFGEGALGALGGGALDAATAAEGFGGAGALGVGGSAGLAGSTADTAAAAAAAPSLFSSAANWASANPLQAAGLGLTAAKALGGSTPTSSTSTTAIDPDMKAAYLRNLEEARTTAGALNQKQFADFSGNYGTAEQQLRNIGLGGAGQTGTAEASRLTGQLAGYTPQNGAQYMSAYQNPYEQQVVQSTINDLDMARMRQQLADRAAATAAKSFGGSRQGVAEALTNEASMRNMGSVVSNLRSAGFNTAAQLGQSDANRMLQGAGLRLNAAGQIGNLAAQSQNLGIAGSQAVMNAEAQRQALEQAKLDAARNLSLERLGISQSALGLQPANLGGSQTTPIYKNQTASALGGALSGGMLGNLIGGKENGGQYAGYGALAGGLLGFL